MNEVTSLANDNDIDIYYTDTDSMHILDRDVEKLEELYKNKYNRNLIGSSLGQFHSDFSLVVDNKAYTSESNGLHSKLFIALGKKCYMDILECEDEGKIINGYHIRFKGVNKDNIKYFCKTREIVDGEIKLRKKHKNNSETIYEGEPIKIEELYEYLYNGKPIEIDIAKGKVRFEYKTNCVRTKKRMVKKFEFKSAL